MMSSPGRHWFLIEQTSIFDYMYGWCVHNLAARAAPQSRMPASVEEFSKAEYRLGLGLSPSFTSRLLLMRAPLAEPCNQT
jgi:hypothetical protein